MSFPRVSRQDMEILLRESAKVADSTLPPAPEEEDEGVENEEEKEGKFEKGKDVPLSKLPKKLQDNAKKPPASFKQHTKSSGDERVRQRLSWDKQARWEVHYLPSSANKFKVSQPFGSQHQAENWVRGEQLQRRSDEIFIQNVRTGEKFVYDPIRNRYRKQAAITPTGLYGYTKAIQNDCEAAVRKLNRQAGKVARAIYSKDQRVAEFLGAHSKRAKSHPAQVLISAIKEMGPKFASMKNPPREVYNGPPRPDARGYPIKEASSLDLEQIERSAYENARESFQEREAREYGMYGYPTRTARLGLDGCATIREHAGIIASDLHRRRQALYDNITGFFQTHAKTARCPTSRVILSCYPESTIKFASDDSTPQEKPASVSEWLAWEE